MMRIGAVAIMVAVAGAFALPGSANAQNAPSGVRLAQATFTGRAAAQASPTDDPAAGLAELPT